jgi:hypothetical protein
VSGYGADRSQVPVVTAPGIERTGNRRANWESCSDRGSGPHGTGHGGHKVVCRTRSRGRKTAARPTSTRTKTYVCRRTVS